MKEMIGGCCICAKETGWQENPIVYCDGENCSVAVHRICYGITSVPEGEWFCRPCELKETNLKCELCPLRYGALKRTNQGKWAHLLCALHIPEIRFGNNYQYEPIILDDISSDRSKNVCIICRRYGRDLFETVGVMAICSYIDCKNYFHATCAQLEGLLCEKNYSKDSTEISYSALCYDHIDKKRKGVSQLQVFKPLNFDCLFLNSSSSSNGKNLPANSSHHSSSLFTYKSNLSNLNLSATSSSSNESINQVTSSQDPSNNNKSSKKKRSLDEQRNKKKKSSDKKDNENFNMKNRSSSATKIKNTDLKATTKNLKSENVTLKTSSNLLSNNKHNSSVGNSTSVSSSLVLPHNSHNLSEHRHKSPIISSPSTKGSDSNSASSSSSSSSSSTGSSSSSSGSSSSSDDSDSEEEKGSNAKSSSHGLSESSDESESSEHISPKKKTPSPRPVNETTCFDKSNKKICKKDKPRSLKGNVSKIVNRRESVKSIKKSPMYVESDSSSEGNTESEDGTDKKPIRNFKSNENILSNSKQSVKRKIVRRNKTNDDNELQNKKEEPVHKAKILPEKTRRKSSAASNTTSSIDKVSQPSPTSKNPSTNSVKKRRRRTSADQLVIGSTNLTSAISSLENKKLNGSLTSETVPNDQIIEPPVNPYPILAQNSISPQLERLKIDSGCETWKQTNSLKGQMGFSQGDKNNFGVNFVNNKEIQKLPSSFPHQNCIMNGGDGTINVKIGSPPPTPGSSLNLPKAKTNNFFNNIVSPDLNSSLLLSPLVANPTVPMDSNNITSMIDSNGLPFLPSYLERPPTPKTIEDFLESQWVGTCQFLLEMGENRDIAATIRDYNQLVKKNVKLKSEIQEANQKFNYFLTVNKDLKKFSKSGVDLTTFTKPQNSAFINLKIPEPAVTMAEKSQMTFSTLPHGNNSSFAGNPMFSPVTAKQTNLTTTNSFTSINDLNGCSNAKSTTVALGNNFLPSPPRLSSERLVHQPQQRALNQQGASSQSMSYNQLNGLLNPNRRSHGESAARSLHLPYNSNYPVKQTPDDGPRAKLQSSNRDINGSNNVNTSNVPYPHPASSHPLNNYLQQQQSIHFDNKNSSLIESTIHQTNGRLTRSNSSSAATATAASSSSFVMNGSGSFPYTSSNNPFYDYQQQNQPPSSTSSNPVNAPFYNR